MSKGKSFLGNRISSKTNSQQGKYYYVLSDHVRSANDENPNERLYEGDQPIVTSRCVVPLVRTFVWFLIDARYFHSENVKVP